MNINRTTASTILTMLEDRSISNIPDDQLEAILALRKIANTRYVDLFVNVVSAPSFVEGIKMIRAVTGLGLRDAKDLYERFDPRHNGGLIGPILRDVEIEEAEHLLAKYNTLGADVVLTLGL